MTKFVGKFRKGPERDYDDYYNKSSKNEYNERRRKSEQAELRRMRQRQFEDDEEYYDPRYYGK